MARKYEPMSDLEVLELLRDGRYVVDAAAGVVANEAGTVLSAYLDSMQHYYVRLYVGKRRRGIALHKLVWMSVTWTIPPAGFEVHHRDEDPSNNSWDNLFLPYNLDHRKLHGADLLAKQRGEAWEGEELPF